MTFVMRVLEDLDFAPGAVAVSVGNFRWDQIGEIIEITLDADPTLLYAEEVPDDGNLRTDVFIPSGIAAGTHTLTGTCDGDSDAAPFEILNDGLDSEDDGEDQDPLVPEIPEPFSRWTFIDVYPGEEETYTFPRNPVSWDGPPERPSWVTFDAACAPSGQILSWQNAGRAWPMTFSGITFTQNEYKDILRWTHKRRRFWLYDHRRTIWFLTITKFSPEPRYKGIVDLGEGGVYDPWLVDYTVEVLIFNRPGDQPFIIEDEVGFP